MTIYTAGKGHLCFCITYKQHLQSSWTQNRPNTMEFLTTSNSLFNLTFASKTSEYGSNSTNAGTPSLNFTRSDIQQLYLLWSLVSQSCAFLNNGGQSQIVLSVWKLFPLEQPSAKILGKFIK